MRGFLSSATNRRTDGYGGSLEHRARLLLEIVGAVRGVIGNRLALGVRLCGDELIDGGTTIDDAVRVAELVEATGQVDYINTSIGVATATLFMIEASMHVPPGYACSSALRKAVDLPVVGVGRFKDPLQAERALAEGHCDLVGVVAARSPTPTSRPRRAPAPPRTSACACPATRSASAAWDSTGGWAASRTLARAASPRAPAFPGECALRRMCWSSVPGPQGCRRPSPPLGTATA